MARPQVQVAIERSSYTGIWKWAKATTLLSPARGGHAEERLDAPNSADYVVRMIRLDRRRLDIAAYPFSTEIQTLESHVMDGHISHAAVVTILQDARFAFDRALGLPHPMADGLRIVVAGLNVEYAAEMYFPTAVEVRCGLLKLGRTSFVLGQIARQGERTTVYAQTALVIDGPEGPTSLPASMRAAYETVPLH